MDLEVGIQMPSGGEVIALPHEAVVRFYPSLLGWNMIELQKQYQYCHGCVLIPMASAHVTVRDWFTQVAGCDFDVCCDIWPQLPVSLMQFAIHERGVVTERPSAGGPAPVRRAGSRTRTMLKCLLTLCWTWC